MFLMVANLFIGCN